MADRPVTPGGPRGSAETTTSGDKPRVLPPMPPQADQQKSSGQGAKKRAFRGRNNAAKPSPARTNSDSNNRPRPAVSDDTAPIPRLGQVSRAEAVAAAQAAGGQRSTNSAPRPVAAPAAPVASAPPAQAARSAAPASASAPARARTAPAAAPARAASPAPAQQGRSPQAPASVAPSGAPARTPGSSGRRPPRRARLRLTRIDPWSVMKTAFLLSIALGIVLIVSVLMIWAVLGAAGLWDSINSTVQSVLGQEESANFDVNEYVGLSRVLGFTVLVAAIDVVLLTAIATLAAFLYNMAAALLGGIELTLAEDRN